MSATVSRDSLNLVSQLAGIQTRKEELSNRIQLYEKKLSMAREAGLALARDEQQVASALHARGFPYDQQPNALPKESPGEITSSLSNLFQQPASKSTTPVFSGLGQANAPNGPQIRGVPKTTAGMAIRRKT